MNERESGDVRALQQRIEELEVIERAYYQLLTELQDDDFPRVLRNITATLNQFTDLESVLDGILRYARELVPCDAASIILLDGDMAEFARFINFTPAATDNLQGFRLPLAEVPCIRYIKEEDAPLIVNDTRVSSFWRIFPETAWVRSALGVPIYQDGAIDGFLFVNSAQTDAFTAKQAERLQQLADHAAVALKNALTYQELAEHADELQALRELSSLLYSTLSLEEVLTRLVGYVERVITTDAVNIMFLEGDSARIVAEHGYVERGGESVLGKTFPLEKLSVLHEVVQTKRAILTEDTEKAPNWIIAKATNWVRSHLAAPIIHNDEVIGCINLDAAQPYLFRPIDMTHLQAFADTASAAVYNTRLYEQLQEREALLRQLAESVDEAFWVVDVQAQRPLYVSPLIERFFGMRIEDVCDAPQKLAAVLHPADREALFERIAAIREAIRNDALASGETLQFRFYRVQDDDLRWALVTLYPLFNEHGQTYRLIGVLKDITRERVQLRRYQALFEQNNDAIMLMDLEGNYVACNQRAVELLGFEREEEVLRLNFRDITADEEVADAEERLARLLQGEQLPPYERTLLLKDGRRIPVEVNVELVKDEDKPLHIQSIFRDISMRRQFEQQRTAIAIERERLRILRDIVQSLSHDFRTPISTITIYIYLLKRSALDEEQRQQVEKLEQQVERLKQLTNNLSSLITWEEPSALSLRQADLNRLVQDAINTIQGKATAKRQIFQTQLSEAALPIHCDKSAVVKALIHVIDNAIQFTPEGGTITIRTEQREGRALVEVVDTGVGIAEEYLPFIFTPFFRADESRNTETGGLGVGLSIVRQIIEAHDGSIEVKSTVGEGTRFYIAFPSPNADGA